jgi:glycosyltransferase involved in cell wall biosynthesis
MGVSNPLPILLMSRTLDHGGSERQAANVALSLDRSRFAPHVAYVHEGYHADAIRRAGVSLIQLPLSSFVGPGAFAVARQLRAYIRANGIRLVHPFDFTFCILGIPVARSCPGTIALSSQRSYMHLVPTKYRYPLLVAHRLAHGVVVNSEALRQHLSQDHGFAESRIEVCRNGLDIDVFSNTGRTPLKETEGASLVVGTACVLRPEKNLGQLLEAFARVRGLKPGIRLLIVGSGEERERLGATANALGLGSDCIFLPSSTKVQEVLRAIDIFVHPSLTEGLPNGVMEAMACGCAVLANRVGGCPELIVDQQTGLLAEPGDIESLTRQLTLAMMDEGLRARIAQNAAEHMKAFSLQKAARRMEAIYARHLNIPDAL